MPRKLTVRLDSDEVFWRPPERLRLAVWPHLRRRKRNARYRRGKRYECRRARQPGRAAGGACGQAAVAGAVAIGSRGRLGLIPLSLVQRCRRGRRHGYMRSGLNCGLVAVMNGRLVLMAEMGLRNRRRERKRDQDDRRSQNSHSQSLQHDYSIVAHALTRCRRGTRKSISSRGARDIAGLV